MSDAPPVIVIPPVAPAAPAQAATTEGGQIAASITPVKIILGAGIIVIGFIFLNGLLARLGGTLNQIGSGLGAGLGSGLESMGSGLGAGLGSGLEFVGGGIGAGVQTGLVDIAMSPVVLGQTIGELIWTPGTPTVLDIGAQAGDYHYTLNATPNVATFPHTHPDGNIVTRTVHLPDGWTLPEITAHGYVVAWNDQISAYIAIPTGGGGS